MKRSREWKDFILSKETKGEGNLKREGRKVVATSKAKLVFFLLTYTDTHRHAIHTRIPYNIKKKVEFSPSLFIRLYSLHKYLKHFSRNYHRNHF